MKRLFLFLLLSLLTASAALCETLPALPVLPDGNTLTYTLTDDVHLLQQYADALCPGYTVVGGKADYISLMLIADSLEGTRHFIGCAWRDGWEITVSTPLPAEAYCDSFHAYMGSMELFLADTEELYRAAGVELQQDGRWLIVSFDTPYEVYGLYPHAVYNDLWGYSFGTLTFQQDITRADWTALFAPVKGLEGTQALLDQTHWRTLTQETLLLTADGQKSLLYGPGTPVRLIESNALPDLLAVDIFGTCGYLPADHLTEGNLVHLFDKEDSLLDRYVFLAPPLTVFDEPEGEVIAEFDHETDGLVLGTDEEWAHIWLPGNDCFSGFIPIGAVMAE